MKAILSILLCLPFSLVNGLEEYELFENHISCFEEGLLDISNLKPKIADELINDCFTEKGLSEWISFALLTIDLSEGEVKDKFKIEFGFPNSHEEINEWIKNTDLAKFLRAFLLDGDFGKIEVSSMFIEETTLFVSYKPDSDPLMWEKFTYKKTKLGWKIDGYVPGNEMKFHLRNSPNKSKNLHSLRSLGRPLRGRPF